MGVLRSRKGLLVLAGALGVLTALLAYVYVGQLTATTQPEEKLVAAVVARKPLPTRTVIRPEMVELQQVPLETVKDDAVIDLAEVENRIVKSDILPGEQVVDSRLYPSGVKPGMTFSIPTGKRAVTISVNEVIGVAGFVKPGDRVDVLGTFERSGMSEGTTMTVLQDVTILAIAQQMTDETPEQARVPTSATLAVTPQEAERVTLAEETGVLRLALRPDESRGNVYVKGVTSGQMLASTNSSRSTTRSSRTPAAVSSQSARVTVKPVKKAPEPWTVELIRGTSREQVTLP